MAKDNFYISSFNVRGLRQQKKRLAIFRFLNLKHKGIIFLQETHSVPSDEQVWKREWGGEIIFNHGTANSRGVAILFNKTYDININKCSQDDQGRILLLEGVFNNYEINLLNIYAPTKDKPSDQLEFFTKVKDYALDIADKLLIGGDFNTCLYPEIDKCGGRLDKQSPCAKDIIAFMELHDLIDVWRIMNPRVKRYTWRDSTRGGFVQSRIDLWLIPVHMLYDLKIADIQCGLYSDHSITSLTFNIPKLETRGRGFWKLNTQLLTDIAYIRHIKQCIATCKNKYKNVTDKRILWDVIKTEIRGEKISFSSYKAKQQREKEESLLLEVNMLEENVDKNPNKQNKDRYLEAKKELAEIVDKKTQGIIIRSRANYVELGEKNSKYFLSLERKNASQKHIRCIKTSDGIYTTNPSEILLEEERFYKSLYSESIKETDQDYIDSATEFLNTVSDNNTLSATQHERCDNDITIKECSEALKDLPNNKSPGSDGFPVEFYKFFWQDIKEIVFNSLRQGITEGELSIEQRRGVLTLSPKKDKDIRNLKNWRPITLLNSEKISCKKNANSTSNNY